MATSTKCLVSGDITAATKTSYEEFVILLVIIWKPFTDAEVVKECLLNASNLVIACQSAANLFPSALYPCQFFYADVVSVVEPAVYADS
ncbi:hypothetical protein TNCV_2398191 [Trichonephila clavipes]|uniref:Uncharacterized protein n=1 Tax=Trichonephila clavipes TaxID=2585209 RepID=A0A8X6VR87_TRICX|nr:hypothetical protein TNCV_2398191 [Trichonephila clavipes]